MACIFNTVLLDLSAAMTDSFEVRGAYSRGGAYWRIYGKSPSRGIAVDVVGVILFKMLRKKISARRTVDSELNSSGGIFLSLKMNTT